MSCSCAAILVFEFIQVVWQPWTAYQPTFEERVFVSTDVCESEWVLANNCVHLSQVLHQPSVVIECSTPLYSVLMFSPLTHNLHMMVLMHAGSGSRGGGETTIHPITSAGLAGQVNCSTLQCQEGFCCSTVRNTSLCLPVCGSWEEYSRGVVLAIDVVIFLSASIG